MHMESKAQGTKEKIDKWDYIKPKNFCAVNNRVKDNLWNRESIYKPYTGYRVNVHNKELSQFSNRQKKEYS